jgi:RNA polymerase sigma factor (sigma-70 family)
MSTTENEFECLMERIRDGDAEAGRILFERYGKDIQLIVRRRLNRRLRSQFDSVDFAQDAWASFFDIPTERYTFQTPEELVAFLAHLAHRKLIDAHRQRFQGAKRNMRRVRSIQPDRNEPPARQPTPSQFALAEDEWERMLHNKPPKLRKALELLRAGYGHHEIISMLGIHQRMLQRLIQSLNEKPSSS